MVKGWNSSRYKPKNNIARNNKSESNRNRGNDIYEADFINLSHILFNPYTKKDVTRLYNALKNKEEITDINEYLSISNGIDFLKST